MFVFWVCLVLIYTLVDSSQQKSDLNHAEFNRLYHKNGNVSFVGVFEDRFGPNCSVEVGRGLEEIASTIWTVEALNRYEYLPGITIGVSVFGVCENSTNLKDFIQATEGHILSSEEEGYLGFSFEGILTTPQISNKLQLSERFPIENLVLVEHVINVDVITDAVVQLLTNLQWLNVNRVISDSENNLKSFKEKALEEGLFIENELLMTDRSPCRGSSESSSVAVVFGAIANISNLTETLCENITLILTPTDFVFDVSLLESQAKDVLVSLPSIADKTVLSGYVKSAQYQKDFFGQNPPVKGPLFLGTAAAVLQLLEPIKSAVAERCQNKHFNLERPCAPFAHFMDDVLSNKTRLRERKSMEISPRDVEETLKVLKIEPSPNDEMFLYITSLIRGNTSEDLAIFQIFNLEKKKFQPILVMINDDSLTNGGMTNRSGRKIDFSENLKFDAEDPQEGKGSGEPVINLLQKFESRSGENVENITSTKLPSRKSCDSQSRTCSDPELNRTAGTNRTSENHRPKWRFLTWVSINTSLGFVGVTCTLSTMLFVVIRLCKDDIVEGSPCFTLLLMISVVFAYFSSIPFHLEFPPGDTFICSYRTNGPPAVFALLFSLLLSRSLVLAFNENDGGFVTHVNGYLQSILCFFMIGVQVSIVSQNWIVSTNDFDPNCVDEYDKHKIFSLGYDLLLLVLLACVSPFIIRSKQNYKEGLLFSISVFFITVVWSAWISFYVLLPNEQKDAALAIGLNSTAAVLLFCVFIPQTYFMAAPFPRGRTLRTLSPLDGDILREVSFKSNQALNEGAFGTIVYKNCEMGLSNPNFQTSRSNGSNNPVTRETVIDASPETSQPN